MLPGSGVTAWPFAEIGHWKMDVAGSADDWVRELQDWRREHLVRIGYDDANYTADVLEIGDNYVLSFTATGLVIPTPAALPAGLALLAVAAVRREARR